MLCVFYNVYIVALNCVVLYHLRLAWVRKHILPTQVTSKTEPIILYMVCPKSMQLYKPIMTVWFY